MRFKWVRSARGVIGHVESKVETLEGLVLEVTFCDLDPDLMRLLTEGGTITTDTYVRAPWWRRDWRGRRKWVRA